jgi:hypothetical protein
VTLQVRRNGLPVPPVEIADEVEAWARLSGRHATLHFIPTAFLRGRVASGTWVVRLTLKPGDKRLLLYREGKVAEPPTEDVWLHEPDASHHTGYRPFDILQLGASGVRTFLEKGDTWSGRGEFRSLEEQLKKVNEDNAQAREKNRTDAREGARDEARDKRRQVLGIPLVGVLADLLP